MQIGPVKKVISGGQTGADIAAVRASKALGLKTGGYMPQGFNTQSGAKPEWSKEYGFVEHASPKYPPRTFANVKESDGTLRFARHFDSPGEKCTLKAINQYKKPHFDVDINNLVTFQEVRKWIIDNDIHILNVAGNSERSCPGIEELVYDYIYQLFAQWDMFE